MKLPRTVYAIQHNKTKRIYVGSSADLVKRYEAHILDLRAHRHVNMGMQEDFDVYGEDYSFFILGTIEKYDERFKEYEWMRRLGSYDPVVGYNIRDVKKGLKKRIPLKEGLPTPRCKAKPIEDFIE